MPDDKGAEKMHPTIPFLNVVGIQPCKSASKPCTSRNACMQSQLLFLRCQILKNPRSQGGDATYHELLVQEELVHEIHKTAERLEKEHPNIHKPPVAVHCVSAETGQGIAGLIEAMTAVLRECGSEGGGDSCPDLRLNVQSGSVGSQEGALSSHRLLSPEEEAWASS
jgi:hypothetical protein